MGDRQHPLSPHSRLIKHIKSHRGFTVSAGALEVPVGRTQQVMKKKIACKRLCWNRVTSQEKLPRETQEGVAGVGGGRQGVLPPSELSTYHIKAAGMKWGNSS